MDTRRSFLQKLGKALGAALVSATNPVDVVNEASHFSDDNILFSLLNLSQTVRDGEVLHLKHNYELCDMYNILEGKYNEISARTLFSIRTNGYDGNYHATSEMARLRRQLDTIIELRKLAKPTEEDFTQIAAKWTLNESNIAALRNFFEVPQEYIFRIYQDAFKLLEAVSEGVNKIFELNGIELGELRLNLVTLSEEEPKAVGDLPSISSRNPDGTSTRTIHEMTYKGKPVENQRLEFNPKYKVIIFPDLPSARKALYAMPSPDIHIIVKDKATSCETWTKRSRRELAQPTLAR